VVRAISEAVEIVVAGKHDPLRAHERVRTFYNWEDVTTRTEVVYDAVIKSPQMELWERVYRSVQVMFNSVLTVDIMCFSGQCRLVLSQVPSTQSY
jgi:phosphatidylinositol glycan class A protein